MHFSHSLRRIILCKEEIHLYVTLVLCYGLLMQLLTHTPAGSTHEWGLVLTNPGRVQAVLLSCDARKPRELRRLCQSCYDTTANHPFIHFTSGDLQEKSNIFGTFSSAGIVTLTQKGGSWGRFAQLSIKNMGVRETVMLLSYSSCTVHLVLTLEQTWTSQ